MEKIKLSISNADGTAKSLEVEGSSAQYFIGKKIGHTLQGTVLGLPDAEFKITGGSDKDGFPMRPDVHGGVRKKFLLSTGIGFKSSKKGQRKRKMIHGNVITEDIIQINLKALK